MDRSLKTSAKIGGLEKKVNTMEKDLSRKKQEYKVSSDNSQKIESNIKTIEEKLKIM